MGESYNEHQEIINQVCTHIENQALKNNALIIQFAKRYFASCSIEDLKEKSIEELYRIVYSHWLFIYQRGVGQAKVHIFNPDETQGWQTHHTIIQISHDDIPFLVDSLRMVINQYQYEIHFIIHFGGLKIQRDKQHRITRLIKAGEIEKEAFSEAPIYIEIDRLSDTESMQKLKAEIERVLGDIRAAVSDWYGMVSRLEACLLELENNPPHLDKAELAESRDFLRWIMNNHFTFLGARDYKLIGDGTNRALQIVSGSGLGVLREESASQRSKSYAELPPLARKMALSKKDILIISKTKKRSTVHRPDYTDYIGIKQFNEQGELIGERRFVGLYTSTAYHSSPRSIPFLRLKVDKILHDLGFPPDSHDGKEAAHLIETLPRDDLFQGSHEELLKLILGIIQLKERKRVRLFVRRDAFHRYFSCLVFVPREIFNTELALTMQSILKHAFNGTEASFSTYFSDSVLARIHFLIRVHAKEPVEYDLTQLEEDLIATARSWSSELKNQLLHTYGEAEGLRYYNKYHRAFPAGYMETYSPSVALIDIKKIESLSPQFSLEMLMQKNGAQAISLKLFHAEQTIILSDALPILENMGLKVIEERPYELKFKSDAHVWVNDFDVMYAGKREIDIEQIKSIFQQAFTKIWMEEVENDGFNRLVLEAHLTWKEIAMLRAYTKYLRQTGFTFSQNYVEQALTNNTDICILLVRLFMRRFNPSAQDQPVTEMSELISAIEQALEKVVSLDEDRILRRLLEVILATIRTNYFQNKPYLSFKINPEELSDLPLPRPKFEIFVYSTRVEGVHLRGGKVARGGIRWSDRREDFRTEVLGLMKAQQVKNTVIVPVGAKGGFVVKKIFPQNVNRDEYLKEGIECYSIFIRGLLDVTDNIKNNEVINPPEVVFYDENDPYLVVAADKGTATFSDIANKIAREYGFWMDDAFASGGSAGYDHKKMGITSRGVWVSVQRHFREIDIDPATTPFTVVGIGDMAGDVFGNGMLMSSQIKLVAAFNHAHIFIDPNPDPATSYEERKRLFQLPRSSWEDYRSDLLSLGGGIFSRSAKSIKITPEIKIALNITQDSMVPNDLIRAILKAPVDLIWNGGIGTFVKSTQESHLDVGDKTNDAIRIDAPDLNARVVAEGGNLGVTQLARIEYALKGGIINTDFIDNSGGVNCSDHEVNIKIILNRLVSLGKMSGEERDQLLEEMTDEVAALVLVDNYNQVQMLSLEASVAQQTMDLFRQYMNDLEKAGRLNRKLEYLPDDKMLAERKASNRPLTRPEIAMLLSYCKMYLKQDILCSEVLENSFFDQYLFTAFPQKMRDTFHDEIKEHSLRKEIVATQLCKAITDRMGINFVERLQRETGASISFIITSFAIAENIYHMKETWEQITALDYKVDPSLQYRMMLQVYYLIRRATRWFLRNRKPEVKIDKAIADFAPDVAELITHLPTVLDEPDRVAFESATVYLIEQGVSEQLAHTIASCNVLFTSLDIIEAAKKYRLNLQEMTRTYYQLGNRLQLNWLRELMNSYVVESQWDELARAGFRDDLDRVQRKLSVSVLTVEPSQNKAMSIEEQIEAWINRYQFLVERWQKLLIEIKTSEAVDFVTYSVVLRELFDFAQLS